jgi:hypothetical protein
MEATYSSDFQLTTRRYIREDVARQEVVYWEKYKQMTVKMKGHWRIRIYCDLAWESRIIRRPSLDNELLKTIAEQRSVNNA